MNFAADQVKLAHLTTLGKMTTKDTVAEAIRSARETLGYNQQRLADLAGFPNLQTISDIERGQREVRSWELVKIAKALHTTPASLLDSPADRAESRVFWRRGGLGAHHPELEAVFRERARRYEELELLCEVTPPAALPDMPLDPERAKWSDAARLAVDVSRVMDLGSRPAASLLQVLETRFRVKIFYEDLGEGESAACVRNLGSAAILMNRKEAPWRRNYSFAHELFHLITWSSVDRVWPEDEIPVWYDHLEKLANSFAADLLLPANEVQTVVRTRMELHGALKHTDLVEIARDFDVSTDALVWRLVNLGDFTAEQARQRLNDSEFRRIDSMSMRGLWTEPDAGLPDRYRRLVRMAFENGALSRTRAAQYLEQNTAELHELDWADDEEAATTAP